MKNSATSIGGPAPNPKSIKVTKRSQPSPLAEDTKKSIDIAETLQYQKNMAQTYRQKNQRNIIKCRFLYNKLSALGNLQGVPEMIATEVSEIDLKIKELQSQLQFKRGQQMKKLRRKVSTFLEQINFQIQPEQMQKIEDEIEIILFLLDIFQEKFNEMTAERKEVNEIIARLEENSHLQPQESEHIKKENQELMAKITQLEGEIEKLKNEDLKKLQTEIKTEINNREQNGSHVSDMQLATKSQEIEKAYKKVQDLEGQLKQAESKYQVLAGSLERSKREEARWKERYRLMEEQKNERIKLLEESVSKKLKQ